MDEKRDFNIAATLLDATKLFISKSKVSPFFPRTNEYRYEYRIFGSSVTTLTYYEK